MRQRLGVGQAMLPRPSVLFLDEPVSSLDPAGRRDVLELIGSLRGTCTVFMSTHILTDVERICDRVGILDHGRLVTEAPMDELRAARAAHLRELDPRARPKPRRWLPGPSAAGAAWVRDVHDEHGLLRVAVPTHRGGIGGHPAAGRGLQRLARPLRARPPFAGGRLPATRRGG